MIYKDMNIQVLSIEEADNQTNPIAVAHFTNGAWDWYIIGADKITDNDYYLYCLVNGFEKELGMATLKQIIDVGAELDTDWTPTGVFDIFDDFDLRR